MPLDTALAARIRVLLTGTPGLSEKKMFGGIGWMVNGHMAAGAHSDGRVMIRCGKDDFEAFIAEPGAAGLIQGGKVMAGWVLVDADAVASPTALAHWVARGRAYASSLPPK